jgi:RecA-family ATPase
MTDDPGYEVHRDDAKPQRPGGNGGEPEREAPIKPLRTVSAASWADKTIPERRWVVLGRLLRGSVAILSGDGGIGKTTIALQAAVGVVLNLGWLNGVVMEQGPVLFSTAEEDEPEVWRRTGAIVGHHNKTLADLAVLHVFSCLTEDIDPTLGITDRNRVIQPTPLLQKLTARVLEIKPALIIIEAAADVFGGNEIVRREVRQFMNLLRQLARKADAAVLLLQHPSQAGLKDDSGKSGSGHWNNAARPRLYFSAPDDKSDVRELRVMKNNYAARGGSVQCRWQNGVFVPVSIGSPMERVAAEASIENAFLACLDAATAQGRSVSHKRSIVWAPAVFEAMPEAAGNNRKALDLAMQRLFSTNRIKVETSGPPSKRRERIVRC